jgi:hypothetical protein
MHARTGIHAPQANGYDDVPADSDTERRPTYWSQLGRIEILAFAPDFRSGSCDGNTTGY